MIGSPASHSDADGRDLARTDPYAGTACSPACGQAEMVQGADDGLLQIEKEAAHPSGPGGDAKHRIDHQLTGKMAGDVPAAPGLNQLHALPDKRLVPDQQVLAPAISAQGDGRRVLQHKERILGPFRNQGQPFQLNGLGPRMADETQIDNLHPSPPRA